MHNILVGEPGCMKCLYSTEEVFAIHQLSSVS